MSQLQEGGSDSWKHGSLIRRLKPVRLASISARGDVQLTGTRTYQLRVQRMVSALTAHIAVGFVSLNPNNNQDLIDITSLPTNPGTMQLLPIVRNPELPQLPLRPVFQDPARTTNINQPQPQQIPFGWSFRSEGADDCIIDVIVDAAEFTAGDPEALEAMIVCAVTIEYTGPWIDPLAFARAIAAPVLQGPTDVENLYNGAE